MRHPARRRAGTTLAELVVVLLVTAVILLIAVPRVRQVVERAAVRGAAADIAATLSAARQVAVSSGGSVSLGIDAPAATLYVLRRRDTVVTRRLAELYGVTLVTTRDSLAFDARGLGVGAANLTFVVERGMTADTVVVSRLGRVR